MADNGQWYDMAEQAACYSGVYGVSKHDDMVINDQVTGK